MYERCMVQGYFKARFSTQPFFAGSAIVSILDFSIAGDLVPTLAAHA